MDYIGLYTTDPKWGQIDPLKFLFCSSPATLTPIIVAALVRFVAQLLIRRAHGTVHILARCAPSPTISWS
jgi:hypothetical protein